MVPHAHAPTPLAECWSSCRLARWSRYGRPRSALSIRLSSSSQRPISVQHAPIRPPARAAWPHPGSRRSLLGTRPVSRFGPAAFYAPPEWGRGQRRSLRHAEGDAEHSRSGLDQRRRARVAPRAVVTRLDECWNPTAQVWQPSGRHPTDGRTGEHRRGRCARGARSHLA